MDEDNDRETQSITGPRNSSPILAVEPKRDSGVNMQRVIPTIPRITNILKITFRRERLYSYKISVKIWLLSIMLASIINLTFRYGFLSQKL